MNEAERAYFEGRERVMTPQEMHACGIATEPVELAPDVRRQVALDTFADSKRFLEFAKATGEMNADELLSLVCHLFGRYEHL